LAHVVAGNPGRKVSVRRDASLKYETGRPEWVSITEPSPNCVFLTRNSRRSPGFDLSGEGAIEMGCEVRISAVRE